MLDFSRLFKNFVSARKKLNFFKKKQWKPLNSFLHHRTKAVKEMPKAF